MHQQQQLMVLLIGSGGGGGGRIAMAAIEWVGRWALSFDLADCFKGSLAVVE